MNNATSRILNVGKRKVSIIGAGFVGASIAYALTMRDIAREIVLIDTNKQKAEGEALDIRHGIPSLGVVDLYAGDYSACIDSDLIIITAGRGRKPGESRLDLANENTKILKEVVSSIQKYYTHGVIIVVSNPVDVLTYKVSEWMQLFNGNVFGTGCILDTSRMIRKIAEYLGLSTGIINGYVIGEHGDRQIPVWSHVTVSGIPIAEYCQEMDIQWNDEIKKSIFDATKHMGADIISSKGRTHYGIATCVCYLADSILNQRPTIVSVSSPMPFSMDVPEYALSVPSLIGPGGVQQRVRDKWDKEEYGQFVVAREKMIEVIKSVNQA